MKNNFFISFLCLYFLFGCGNSDRREISTKDSTTNERATYRIDLFERLQNDSTPSTDSRDSNSQRHEARRDLLDAQDDLNSAVRRLSNGDWDGDFERVRRRLNDLEDANNRYSAYGGNSNLGSDIDRMRSQLRRLESDDWREVVPDIQRTNRSIDFESNSLRDD